MPGISGIQLVNSMNSRPMVIFITAYENFALEKFYVNVIDYPMKPVSFECFLKAVNKANDVIKLHSRPEKLSQVKKQNYFLISADYTLVRIAFADILYIVGLKDYVKIHNTTFP